MGSPPETAPNPASGPGSPDRDSPVRGVSAVGSPAPPSALAIWGALLIVYLVWGSTYLAIRVAVETLPPLLSAGSRFMVAALIMAPIVAMRGGWRRLRVSPRQLVTSAVVGVLLLAGGNGLVVWAEAGPPGEAVPSGVAALLIALVPLLLVVMRAATGDRPSRSTVLGVLVGFAGLIVLVAAGGGAGGTVPVVGAFIVLAAATSWAIGSFLSNRIGLPPDPFVATVYESAAGGGVLLLVGLIYGERLDLGVVSGRSWFAQWYLIIIGSVVAFTAFVWLLHNAPISLATTYAYVNPVVAVLLGALIVDEPITLAIVLGGLVIVLGVAMVISTERPRKRAPAAAPAEPGTP